MLNVSNFVSNRREMLLFKSVVCLSEFKNLNKQESSNITMTVLVQGLAWWHGHL